MKATEIFVEQVLIGFVLLAIVSALASPCSLAAFPGLDAIWELHAEYACPVLGTPGADETKTPMDISLAVLATGLAYFLGLIYDRIADTLCAAWEQHNRLQIALKDVERDEMEGLPESGDPFPEDKIRYVLQGSPSRVEWADYLRSRIRLTRALATLIPALGATSAVLIGAPENAGPVAFVLLAIYLAVPAAAIMGRGKFEMQGLYPPKTRESEREKLRAYWNENKRPTKEKGKYKGVTVGPRVLVHEPTLWGLAAAMLLTYWCGATGSLGHGTSIVIALVTGGLTMLIGNVWWRINRTFLYYLKAAYEIEVDLRAERIAWETALSSKAEEKPRPVT
jgi:hypothetical protein